MLSYFSTRGFRKYLKLAKEILLGNWTGSYTKPSPSLYPHQWNWDSAFIAIGYAHYDQERAQQEILSLFENQWSNGMVPQIVFNPQALGHYFPEPDFWQVPDGRPSKSESSGRRRSPAADEPAGEGSSVATQSGDASTRGAPSCHPGAPLDVQVHPQT